MVKSTRKKVKGTTQRGKSRGTAESRTKVEEYVSHLLELHKLQGALLTRLHKEVRRR